MTSDSAPPLGQGIAPTWSAAHIWSVAGAASVPALKITGTIYSAGSGTTNFPLVLIQPTGATANSAWAAAGTYLGVNGHTGGRLLDLCLDGTTQFNVSSAGAVAATGAISGNTLVATVSVTSPLFIFTTTTFTLSSPGTGVFQIGAADSASPPAHTVSFSNVVGGTSNTAGTNNTFVGSRSTGSGVSGDLIFQTGGTGAAATVQNAGVVAMTLKGATQLVILGKAYTVAALPAASSGLQGAKTWVTDALTPAWGAGLTGGGTTVCQVFCTGTAWVAG